ncbi:MAG: hypothetical protein P8Y94_05055 [Acidobacteriota bacterium]
MTLRKAGRWAIFPFLLISMTSLNAAGWKLIGWNDLGMHCMDSDYQVFSILPPYNNIHAQLIDNSGRLIRDPGGIVVTYEAVADPTGSIDSTSAGKTNFWSYVGDLFGVDLAPDQGLAGNDMPGPGNQPQPMAFDAAMSMFQAEGVPLTPYDDSGHKNFYPMFKLVARDSGGTILATTDVVLPISDEMDCSRCHASGSDSTAEPTAGWVNDPDSERDFRVVFHCDRKWSFSALLVLSRLQCAAGNRDRRDSAAHSLYSRLPCQCDRSSDGSVARCEPESDRLLFLPPRFGDSLSARSDGQRRRGRRKHGNSVPELSRYDEPSRGLEPPGMAG